MKASHEWVRTHYTSPPAIQCALCKVVVYDTSNHHDDAPPCIELPDEPALTAQEIASTVASRNDRDGFYKMAVVAFAANMAAHHRDTPNIDIVNKAATLAELSWHAIQVKRSQWAATELQSEAKIEPPNPA